MEVQAAPGSGKTSLLAAKLCLLAREWKQVRSGICVLTHTNAAREEVEQRVLRLPEARGLLRYPHFVGTSTKLLHDFIAKPVLLGRGVRVAVVDDDLFAREAARRLLLSPASKWVSKHPRKRVERNMVLDPEDMTLAAGEYLPEPGPALSGIQRVRREMTGQGLFLFADLQAIAVHALNAFPVIAARLSQRFPVVFVDEAQDTRAEHCEVVRRAFARSSVSWLGEIPPAWRTPPKARQCARSVHGKGEESSPGPAVIHA